VGTWLLFTSTTTAAHLVYVTNEKDNTVSIIDTKTNEVVNTIDVGERPRGITFNKDFSKLFICASDSDAVQVYDMALAKLTNDLPSGEDPEQFILHPDNKHLYIANEDDATVVAQIDVGVEPEGMAVSHDGKWVIVTSETSNMAHWVDTQTNEVVANTLVDQRPRDAEFSGDDKELWVSSEIGGTVAVIDVATKQTKQTLSFEIQGISREKLQPVGMELTADGKLAFIALGPANHVAVVDRSSMEVIKYILVGKRVWHLALTPEQDKLYTTNGVSGDVTVIDVASLRPKKTIKVGRYPWGAAVLPEQFRP